MAYTPPQISSAGLSINNYSEIIAYLTQQLQNIYGPQIYLGIDAADYQDLSVRALQNTDIENALVAVYSSFNPLTAIGASLDLLGILIGTPRKSPSFSTAAVTLTGTPFTNIINGIAQDTAGNVWVLPPVVTLGSGGNVISVVTAQVLGPISAAIGVINIIATPTLGWTSITNTAAATPGLPVEADSAYRARLMISQALPSISLPAGTAAALAGLFGVTRSVVYENNTHYTQSYGIVNTSGTTVNLILGYPFDATMIGQLININGTLFTVATVPSSSSLTTTTSPGSQTGVNFFTVLGNGIALGPPNSITCVVEGGAQQNIALAIYNNRGIGPYTNGSTSTNVTDPNNGNITRVINYFILAYTPIFVTLNVHPLAGFTSATLAAISTNIANYLNNLSIGETVVYSELYGAALTARPNPEQPEFSIKVLTSGKAATPTGTSDIPILYNFAAQGNTTNIVVNLV